MNKIALGVLFFGCCSSFADAANLIVFDYNVPQKKEVVIKKVIETFIFQEYSPKHKVLTRKPSDYDLTTPSDAVVTLISAYKNDDERWWENHLAKYSGSVSKEKEGVGDSIPDSDIAAAKEFAKQLKEQVLKEMSGADPYLEYKLSVDDGVVIRTAFVKSGSTEAHHETPYVLYKAKDGNWVTGSKIQPELLGKLIYFGDSSERLITTKSEYKVFTQNPAVGANSFRFPQVGIVELEVKK